MVANQDADTLVSLWIDPGSGRLDATGHTLRLAQPSCVLMLPRWNGGGARVDIADRDALVHGERPGLVD